MNTYNEIQEPKVFVSTVNQEMAYSTFVDKLFKNDTDDMEYMHAALGVAGEAGELADAIKKVAVYGKPVDRDNIVEELGDLRFYMQAIMNRLYITEAEVLQSNADKLGKRYPKGEYSNADAIERKDKIETLATSSTDLLDDVVTNTMKLESKNPEPEGIAEQHWGITKEQMGSN